MDFWMQACYTRLSNSKLIELHGRIVEYLEASPKPTQETQAALAHHRAQLRIYNSRALGDTAAEA